jgi:hypothetical protein
MAKPQRIIGRLSISRPSGGASQFGLGAEEIEKQRIRVEVICKSSGTIAFRLEVGLLEFAEALLGMSEQPCIVDLMGAKAGLVMQSKTDVVDVPRGTVSTKDRHDQATKAVAAHEVDGWMGDVSDATNFHKHVRQDGPTEQFRVGFSRYVEPETKTVADARAEGWEEPGKYDNMLGNRREFEHRWFFDPDRNEVYPGRRRLPPEPEPEGPVCSRCQDTHVMRIPKKYEGSRKVPCTACPTPCPECRDGRKAYCREPRCSCKCHKLKMAEVRVIETLKAKER